ncbi:MAG: hypothetical protein EG826_16720 [Deltaproteobacteria bacterium]|nr:hypothetical protein [Deltaproteobacteria bacterium]
MLLNRYGLDLTRLDYSCIGSTVYLSGELVKTDAEDVNPAIIESLFKEIARISGVRYLEPDIQNWSISADEGSWQITKSKQKSREIGIPVAPHGGITEAAKDLHIEVSEQIADVLKDIEGKTENKD